MGKVLALLFMILLAIASVAGYLVLTEIVIAGEKQLASGQKRLEKGQPALEEGQAKLAGGKRALSEGKKEYEQAKDNPFLMLADKLLQGGKGFKEARHARQQIIKNKTDTDQRHKQKPTKHTKLDWEVGRPSLFSTWTASVLRSCLPVTFDIALPPPPNGTSSPRSRQAGYVSFPEIWGL